MPIGTVNYNLPEISNSEYVYVHYTWFFGSE